jgi:hypothetical protein
MRLLGRGVLARPDRSQRLVIDRAVRLGHLAGGRTGSAFGKSDDRRGLEAVNEVGED